MGGQEPQHPKVEFSVFFKSRDSSAKMDWILV
jgi:hypothetical protein